MEAEPKPTWEQIDAEVLKGINHVYRALLESDQIDLADRIKYAEKAYSSLSQKVRTQVNNDHAAEVYRRMMKEFGSNETLMTMFTDLLATAKLYNADFVNDLMDIDNKYGIKNE